MKKTFSPILLLSAALCCESYRILIGIPACSETHQRYFLPLWEELANRGHDLVILTTHPHLLRNRVNVQVINLNFTDCGYIKQVVENENSADLMYVYMKSYFSIGEQQLKSPLIQNLIKNTSETFDLLMLEHFYFPMYAFKQRFNCPFIGLSSLAPLAEIHNHFGNPTHLILYPNLLNTFSTDGFYNRLKVVSINIYMRLLKINHLFRINHVIQQTFGSDYNCLTQLIQEMDLLLMNWNPVFTGVMSLSPATVPIAGLQIHEPRPLPKFLQAYADKAEEGLVLWSFGNTVKSSFISTEKFQMIFKAFAKLPYKVICKLDNFSGDLYNQFNVSSNVFITKFVPQQDLLRHKNMRVFFTQGGLHSLEESILAHVPVVVMPLIADQMHNALRVIEHGLGIELKIGNFNPEQLALAIVQVGSDPKFKAKTKEIAAWMQDEPMSSLERAVWWTEYVIRHKGAKHLRSRMMPIYQYYYLDIILFYLAAVYLLTKMLKWLFSRCLPFKE